MRRGNFDVLFQLKFMSIRDYTSIGLL